MTKRASLCFLLLLSLLFSVGCSHSVVKPETVLPENTKEANVSVQVQPTNTNSALPIQDSSTAPVQTTTSEAEKTPLVEKNATATPKGSATPLKSPTVKPSATVSPTPKKDTENTYKLVVYIGSQSVVAYTKDENGNFTRQAKTMICSTGTGSNTPTGSYSLQAKYTYRHLDGAYGQYCSRIVGGILFHSVPISESATTQEEGRKMMSVSAYNKLGSKASHGCVRMRVIDAYWIFNNCPIGTPVEITNNSGPTNYARPQAIKKGVPYTNEDGSRGWDPSDPHSKNPYKNDVPTQTPDKSATPVVTVTPTLPVVTQTPAPATETPTTPVPATPVPATPVPATPVPSTPVPSTQAPIDPPLEPET